MEENTQPIDQQPVEESPSFSFVSDEQVAEMQQPQVQEQPTQEAAQEPQEETYNEPQPDQQEVQQGYVSEEVEGAVFEFLSERLGRDIASFEDLQAQQQFEEREEIDERISAIADFVSETGRDPQDWFIYQQLNPSEMDDMTAVQVHLATQYPNLSQEEIQTLTSGKYKLNPEVYSEEEVQLSQLQVKIDATNARQEIDNLRSRYQAPERQQEESEDFEDILTEDWVNNMKSELDALEGIEFDLGNGKSFTFGMNENYKGQLSEKNARLDEFFNPYVREDGSWDYDTLNMHRALIDNADSIVQSVYKQGLSDGQRGIVERSANMTPTSPNQGRQPNGPDPLVEQLKQALGQGGSGFGFI